MMCHCQPSFGEHVRWMLDHDTQMTQLDGGQWAVPREER